MPNIPWRSVLYLLVALVLAPFSALPANLTISGVVEKSPAVIVYELPDLEGRAEAVRYAVSLQGNIAPNAQLIDAGSAGNELWDQLKHGFVLITTFSERTRLLRRVTAPLGWSIEGGNFRWREVTTPVDTAVVLAAVKNPFGDGKCVVVAAGRNYGVAGFRNRMGTSSFYVFRGPDLLTEGLYDETYQPRKGISKAEAKEDIEQFFSTLENKHPKLLAKITQEQYRKLRLLTTAVARDDLPVEELAYALYYAAAYFQDGHTTVQWLPDLSEGANRRFPSFRLNYENGRFLIAGAVDQAMAGAELIAVNGQPVREFLRPILERNSGETEVYRATRFIIQEWSWYYMSNLFGGAPTYKLKLRSNSGAVHETTMSTLSLAEYKGFLDSPEGNIFRPNHRGTSVEFLGGGHVAHFLYPAFLANGAQRQRIDAIFQDIQRQGSKDLIIDIRGNGGGNSSMGELILSYLYAHPFCTFSKVEVKQEGRVHIVQPKEESFPRPAPFFEGRTYLLIDHGTFSSASGFAAMVRDYKVGVIIGYETGGLPNGFGDVFPFRLTNSGILCGVSFKHFWGPKPRPGDDRHGVLPDIPLNPRVLAEFEKEPDPALAYTLRLIERTRK